MSKVTAIRSLVGRMSPRNRRVREKYCLLLILLSFFVVCVGLVFFLPDLRAGTSSSVQGVYQKIPELFLAPHLPPPPLGSEINEIDGETYNNAQNVVPRPLKAPNPRYLQDREKLYAKIMEEEKHKGILEKPRLVGVDNGISSSSSTVKNSQINAPGGSRDGVFKDFIDKNGEKESWNNLNDFDMVQNTIAGVRPWIARGNHTSGKVLTEGGEDPDPDIREKRDFVKQMMKDAWDNYAKYAWGSNELKPMSQRGHSASIFGPSKLGATIVDALDTLYIMGLHDEFNKGREWVANEFQFENVKAEVSVFETNIRFVGGFLTAYALTGDELFKEKALQIATKLLPAFDTATGIPYSLISLNSQSSKNYGWAASGSSILSEFGTLHLEFTYLSDITGNPIFKEKVYKIREVLKNADKPKGLYPNYFHPRMGKFTQNHVSLGALGDSFYEYLLKSYLQTGDADARQMYDEAVDAFEKNGLIRYSKNGLLYLAEMRYDRIESKMDHLACFAGGMFALGAHTDPNLTNSRTPTQNVRSTRHMRIAEGITNTCHESYIRTNTRLGPESFRFSDAMEARAVRQNEKYYILRPEVIESYFVLWRLTGDPKYREWGWDAVQAIQKYCKVSPNGGYAGIRNVYNKEVVLDDVQQSFFLAETLKYLYLLFSSRELIDLDYWVFNTEAHPLPIKGVNPYYRPYKGPRSQ